MDVPIRSATPATARAWTVGMRENLSRHAAPVCPCREKKRPLGTFILAAHHGRIPKDFRSGNPPLVDACLSPCATTVGEIHKRRTHEAHCTFARAGAPDCAGRGAG